MSALKKSRILTKAEKLDIVLAYQSLVVKIAKKYAKRCIDPLEDLIQVGMIALLEAANNFQKTYKNQFKTYAIHFISGHIRHYLRDKQSLFKGPRSLQELSYKLDLTKKMLVRDLGREPENNELAEAMALSKSEIDEVFSYEKKISVIWLDQYFAQDQESDGRSLLDIVFDPKANQDLLDEKIILWEAINKLNPTEKQMIELRYFNGFTQSELSGFLGISQMEVCRKLKKLEKHLRFLIAG